MVLPSQLPITKLQLGLVLHSGYLLLGIFVAQPHKVAL